MNKTKTAFLSIVCLIITTNLYAAQPILPQLAADYHTNLSQMGIFMTLTFLGNGIAQVTVIPLADKYEKRSLTQIFLLIGVVSNLLMAFSSSIPQAFLAGVLIGFYSCANMLVLSFASSIATREEKGKVTASIMAGVLSGILLSRMLSGGITEIFSWRVVYLAITVFVVLSFAGLFFFAHSQNKSNAKIHYIQLLFSMIQLIREKRKLKIHMILGMNGFLVFNFLWTGLTFLLSSTPFYFDGFTIGLFGLAGVSGILSSKKAGALYDTGWGQRVILYAWGVLGISWLILMGVPFFSSRSIRGAVMLLGIGIMILDAAMQAQHITNQTSILSSYGKSESRALTAYMACNLLTGSAASLIIALCYASLQWVGICIISLGVCATSCFIQAKSMKAPK